MKNEKIPLYRPPRLRGKYVQEVLRSRWLTAGPMCERFRRALGRYLFVDPRRIALASRATSAFQAVLDHLWAAGRRTVSITEATYPGMRLAVGHAGMRFSNTGDVVVITDIGGRCAIDNNTSTPPSRSKAVVHDACHSFYRKDLSRVDVDYVLYSCYPTKPIPGAEGGVVVCSDAEDAEDLELRVSSGLSTTYGRGLGAPAVPLVAGRETHMTDVQAALNLEALEVSDRYMEAIAESWGRLRDAAECLGVPYRRQDFRPYLFQVVVDNVPALRLYLHKEGIESGWNFRPAVLCTLPCYPGMSSGCARRVINTVRSFLDGYEED